MSIYLFSFSEEEICIPDEAVPAFTGDFIPVLRFVVCSDAHIQGRGDFRCDHVKKVLSFAGKTADSSDYKSVDAAVFAGDSANKGTPEQIEAFADAVHSEKRSETRLLACVAKNHDCGTFSRKETLEMFSRAVGITPDCDEVINGFHFICISCSPDETLHYSVGQRKWLEERLSKAAAEDEKRPVFVFTHEHVYGTVYGSSWFDGWGIPHFTDILSRYPQVVHFSGHSHYPLSDPRSIWQGAFTAVGTGTLDYLEFTANGERKVRPPEGRAVAQGRIVEADKDNRIRLTGFDALSGSVLCECVLENPSDITKRRYTPAQQKNRAKAPAFSEGAFLRVDKTEKGFEIISPAAHSRDGNCVFLYRLEIKNGQGETVRSEYKLNDYWNASPQKSIAFVCDEQYSGFTAVVTAENSYEMASHSLEALLK